MKGGIKLDAMLVKNYQEVLFSINTLNGAFEEELKDAGVAGSVLGLANFRAQLKIERIVAWDCHQ